LQNGVGPELPIYLQIDPKKKYPGNGLSRSFTSFLLHFSNPSVRRLFLDEPICQARVEVMVEFLQYRQRKFVIEEEDDGTCSIWESCAIYSKSQAELFYPPPPQDFVKRKKQGAKSQLNTIYYPVFELTD
jgi:hypothetical protein